MNYTIITLSSAEREFFEILEYIAAHSKVGAEAWLQAYDEAIGRLEDGGHEYPLAAENDLAEFEIREISFKTRRGLMHRIMFSIREDSVLLLHIRRAGQELMNATEIRDPDRG